MNRDRAFSIVRDSLLKDLNIAKDIILSQMLKDKVITQEQANEYSTRYQFLPMKRNWFSANTIKLFFKDLKSDQETTYRLVRIDNA